MQFPVPGNLAARRAIRRSGHWLRYLSAPAAALLTLSLITTVSPLSADGATSGTLSVHPAKSVVATLASSRMSSKTVVNIKVPTSLPFYGAVQLRSTSASSGYRAKMGIAADGTVSVSLSRVKKNVETPLGDAVGAGFTARPGQTIRLQGAIAGKSPVRLYVRVWLSTAKAPSTWQLATLDSSSARLTGAGKTRLWEYLSSSAPKAAKVPYSKVSTSATSVKKVKAFKVKTWTTTTKAAATPPTSSPTPTPTVTPSPTNTPSPSATPTPPTNSVAPASAKPNASTTGVRAGTTLTRHDGDITVTKDGTVLSNLDIHGFVNVRAKNVTISNCIVRGGQAKGVATGLITDYGYAGLVISDVDVIPEHPSVYFDGIKGSDFTARRVHVVGNVDSVKIHGDNVTVQDSLLENTTYYQSDPQQNGGPTHNDNIQILYGKNIKIVGNTIRGATNFAVLGGATKGDTDLAVQNNWLDGGHCTVKLQILNGYAETAKVTGNYFGPDRQVSSCAFTAYPAVKLTQSGNAYEIGGGVVTPLILVS